MMRHYREREWQKKLSPPAARIGLGVWAFFAKRPALYRAITGIAARFLKMVGGRRGHIAALPLPRGWFAVRDLPAPQGKTFHELWKARQ
jgi:L-lactate dehydrogenase complex protein LldF